jgi:hypothetical protein
VTWLRRAWWGALGLACFGWLSSEDRRLASALALAALLTLTVSIQYLPQLRSQQRSAGRRWMVCGLAGGAIGAAVPLVAAGWMLVKISLHSHTVPDFTASDLVAVLSRIHIWAIGGGLVGLAVAVLRRPPAGRNPS